jgi:uncharacterized membrane protein YbhN (UPF0104 family)
MKLNLLSALKYALSTALAVGLFWYLYRNQPIAEMFEKFKQINYWWVLLSGIIYLFSHYNRAVRWRIMLQPLGYETGDLRTFLAVMVGYLANLAVPRMGEVTRCAMLNRTTNVPINVSFGAVVAERVIDMICMLVITFAIVLIEFDKIGGFILDGLNQNSQNNTNNTTKWLILGFIALCGLLGLGFIILFRKKLQQLPLYDKIEKFVLGLRDGLLSVLQLDRKRKILFFLHTVSIWTCYCLTSYFLFFTLPETSILTIRCGLAVLVMSGISVIIPAPAGSAGVYHYFIGSTVVLYGVTQQQGMELAFLMHTVQTLFIIFAGSISLAVSLFLGAKSSVK